MKKLSLVHGVWLIAAIGSFVLGARIFPADRDADGTGADFGAPAIGSRGKSSGSAGMNGGSGSRGGRSGSSARGSHGSGGDAKVVLSDQDITTLGEQFRKATNPIDRRLAFSRLLEGLTAENALQVREQIAHMHHHSAEFREFHYAWGAVGGVDAIMFGADTEKDDMSPALAGWASADPKAALAWYDGLDLESDSRFDPVLKDRKIPADALRHGLMRGLVQGLADADPYVARQFVQRMEASGNEAAGGLMQVVVESVLRESDDPSDAVSWSESLPPGTLRNVAMQRVARDYARKDPESAAEWAAGLADQPESARVVGEVASNWAGRDPLAAVSWVNELPAGDGQNAGMARVLGHWAGRDPSAAGEYLQAMPASPVRDAAVSGYSRRVVWEDPRAAMNWAETISSEDQRTEAVIEVGWSWRRKDAAGAAEWVNSSGLPEDVQEAILNPPRRDRE